MNWRHIALMTAGELASCALSRPWVWLLTYRQIDRLIGWQRYRETYAWNGEKSA